VSAIVVGVDGGGSKTRAVVADHRGTEIVAVDGDASAVKPGRAEESAAVIASVVRDALAAAGMPHVTPRVLCVGVAGVGRETERQQLWQALMGMELADEIVVHADATVALDDAFGDGPGILLVAGTGSIAYGRSPAGNFARCGGWGSVIGDEGSGAWIGRRALSIVTAASDGREPETALSGAILTATQTNETTELINWASTATPRDLASLAPAVMSTAEGGDLRASALVTMAAEELALHVRTLARALFMDERASIPVALGGGLLGRRQLLRKRVESRLRSLVPGAQVQAAEVVPARGAVRGALRFLGPVEDDVTPDATDDASPEESEGLNADTIDDSSSDATDLAESGPDSEEDSVRGVSHSES
jgi:glucosamine kinase